MSSFGCTDATNRALEYPAASATQPLRGTMQIPPATSRAVGSAEGQEKQREQR